MKITFTPNKSHVYTIRNWLIEEQTNFRRDDFNGFYCNWRLIISSFEKKQMAVALQKDFPIGFATWYERSNYSAAIDIVEIHFRHRHRGIGTILINQLFTYFKAKGKVAIDLECNPSASKNFWKKLGFIEFDPTVATEQDLHKILIPTTRELIDYAENKQLEIVELWNLEPHQPKTSSPKWRWEIKYRPDSNQLLEPIIIPCNSEWRIRWKKGIEIVADECVKYFGRTNILHGDYLIIEELNN